MGKTNKSQGRRIQEGANIPVLKKVTTQTNKKGATVPKIRPVTQTGTDSNTSNNTGGEEQK